jgi:hypothetical protein
MISFKLQQETPAQVAVGETAAPSHLPSASVAPRLRDSRFLGATSRSVNLRTRRSQQQQTKTEQVERKTKFMKMKNTVISIIIAVTQSKWLRPALMTLALLATVLVVTGCPAGHQH